MRWIALLWLAAAAPPQDLRQTLHQILMDEVDTIPAFQRRSYSVVLNQTPVTIECDFQVLSVGSGVRIELVNAEGLAAWRQGHGHKALASTSLQRGGQLRHLVLKPDTYAVIVDNSLDGRSAAQIQLRVSVDFPARQETHVRLLSPARRGAVAAISLAIFLGIVTYAGKRLRAAWR